METIPWDAARYDEVSRVQLNWGRSVLGQIDLAGREAVVDAGCGTGRLTELLADRLPQGRVLATDVSAEMLAQARRHPRVHYFRSDLMDLPLAHSVDLVFSNAVFHWVLDHERLFHSIAGALRHGGRLVAQCGGHGNLTGFHARARLIAGRPDFAPHFHGFREALFFANREDTEARLRAAGFVQIETSLVPAPTEFPSREAFRDFCATVTLRSFLVALPAELRARFVEEFVDVRPNDWSIDYVRLNMVAQLA